MKQTAILVVVAPLLLAAQASAQLATLEGRVVDAATGQPVAGALVGMGLKTQAVSAADGSFRLAGLDPASYPLETRHSGFLASMQRVKLAGGETLANWRVELVRSGEISGKVGDQDGWPAEGCYIEARRYVYHEGRRELESSGSATTNDLGEFWIGGLPPGRYYLRATPAGSLEFWDPRYGATFYASTAAINDAVPVEVTAGQPHAALANIHMLRRQGVRITGEVEIPEAPRPRHAVASVSLVCDDYGSSRCMSGKVSHGVFTISDVPPGSYTLEASAGGAHTPEGIEPSLAASQRIDVGTSDIGGLVLKLEPKIACDLPATVTIEGNVKPDELRFNLQPVAASTITELLKPDGSMVFHHILPGRYSSIKVFSSHNATLLYLKSAQLGDEDILGREFTIANKSDAPLRLTLSAAAMAEVTGVVTDAAGRPAAEVTVGFTPTTPRNPYSAGTAVADQTGAFSFSVPEGEYRVVAFKTLAPMYPFEDPGPLEQPDAQTLALKPGANPSLKLVLAR